MSLTETNVSIDEIGKTHQLTATIVPSNATNKIVNWVSTNTDYRTYRTSQVVESLIDCDGIYYRNCLFVCYSVKIVTLSLDSKGNLI